MSFENLLGIFSLASVQRALVCGVLLSLCAALLGVILVQKRYALIGHGLSDVSFASVALSLALGLPPLGLSVPIVIASAFGIMYISQRKGAQGDTVIGMLATGSLAAGIIITSLSTGFNTDVYSYMFGSIVAVNKTDLILSIVLTAIVVSAFIFLYNRLFLITYDENYAAACGVKTGSYQLLLSLLTALTVVLCMKLMGTLLISALIIFPTVSARRIAKSFKSLVVATVIISVACFLAGMVCSAAFDLPSGASVVAVNLAVWIICSITGRFTNR